MKVPAWWPKALLVLLVIGAWQWYGHEQRNQGELRQRIHDTEQRVVAREKVIAMYAGKLPAIEQVRLLWRGNALGWAGRYQHLRDSLFANGESVPPIILTADSTVAACSRALATCDSAIAIRDLLLAHKDTLQWATDSLLRLERKKRPSRFGCAGPLAVNTKGAGLGVACGLRF